MIWFIVIALILLFFQKSESKLAKLTRKLDTQVRYETMTRIFVETMLNLSVSSLINLTFGSLDNVEDIISYIVALVIMVMILFVIGYSFVYPFIFHNRIITHPDFNERHCFLFLEFKRERLESLLFYWYFMLHRLMMSVVFVWMNSFPIHQWALLLYFNLLMLIYCLTFKPFKSQLQNYLNCFNWTVLTVFSLMMFMFLSSTDSSKITICSYVSIGIICVFLIVNWVVIFPITTYFWWQKIKEKWHKKTEQEIEDENKIKAIRQLPQANSKGILIDFK